MNKVEKLIKQALKDNLFGDDCITEARTVLTWLFHGRSEAEKVSQIAVKNLVKNGFAKKDKLIGDITNDLWLVLAICGAKGWIKQTTSKK